MTTQTEDGKKNTGPHHALAMRLLTQRSVLQCRRLSETQNKTQKINKINSAMSCSLLSDIPWDSHIPTVSVGK